jgi:hypothetical protein
VSALIENQAGLYPDVDDTGRALVKFRSGLLASVEAGWLSHSWSNALLLTTEKGFVEQRGDNLEFTPAGGKPEVLEAKPGVPSGVKRLKALLEGELDESLVQSDIKTFLDAAEAMEACYKSSESGQTINL